MCTVFRRVFGGGQDTPDPKISATFEALKYRVSTQADGASINFAGPVISFLEQNLKSGERQDFHEWWNAHASSEALGPCTPSLSPRARANLFEESLKAGRDDIAVRCYEKNPSRLTDQGTSLLNLALHHKRASVVKSLIRDFGISVKTADRDGNTPLHLATQKKMPVIKDMIEKGAPLDHPNGAGRTPVHMAVVYRNRDALEQLIKAGAPLDCHDASGRTPLHVAAEFGYEDDVRLLLNAGASHDVKDEQSKTPFDLAKEKDTVAQMLESAPSS